MSANPLPAPIKTLETDNTVGNYGGKYIMTLSIMEQGHLSMSSREIAVLCEKQHRNVLADIRKMLRDLSLEENGYAHFSADPQNGQQYEEDRIGKDVSKLGYIYIGTNDPNRVHHPSLTSSRMEQAGEAPPKFGGGYYFFSRFPFSTSNAMRRRRRMASVSVGSLLSYRYSVISAAKLRGSVTSFCVFLERSIAIRLYNLISLLNKRGLRLYDLAERPIREGEGSRTGLTTTEKRTFVMADTKHSTKDTRPHHDRINAAKRELLAITGILSKLCGNGETPMESNLEWFIPKLDAVSDMLDCIEWDLQEAGEEITA